MSATIQSPPFAIDDVVYHENFGLGRVLSVPKATTNGNDVISWRVEVDFEGRKALGVASTHLRLESQVDQVDRIRSAMTAYGRLSAATHEQLKRAGFDILAALVRYLHREKALAFGVPPHGECDPDSEYRDAIFSSYDNNILSLDPIDMGLAIKLENLHDDGACWIRLRLTLERAGDEILVSIGETQLARVPGAYQDNHLAQVASAIADECVSLFNDRVDHVARGYYGTRAPIGFVRR